MEKTCYSVLIGRDGPNVYSDWSQCERAVSGFPDSCFACFATREEAVAWVTSWAPVDVPLQLSNQPEPLHSSEPLSLPGLNNQDQEETVKEETVIEETVIDTCITNNLKPLLDGSCSDPVLSVEQKRVLDRVKRGDSVFFTGSAGTGKSFLLRKIIESLHGPSQSLAVTASTGIAALNIGGTTLHSFAGVGLGKGSTDALLEKVKGSRNAIERWRHTEILVIDEVSMIDGVLFDALEFIAREVRDTDSPFGGIQLVLSGDFCQLPPVPDHLDGVSLPIKFAFEADSWDACVGSPVILQKVFRQEDKEFVGMLNRMRYGNVEKKDEERFLALSRPLHYDDGIDPTELFPLRSEVERANATRLASLPGPSQTYEALDIPGLDSRGALLTAQRAEKLLDRLVAVKRITLKIGAQVMLIKNLSPGLVNGLLGKVTAFKTVFQAINDCNELSVPDNGRSRYHTGQERVWPLVRFTNGREILCGPEIFDVVNARGKSEAKREQIPLILAWAMSVHKSQGQTLDRVKVNLARTFEKGQAYVALSRARRMETLQVLHFSSTKVMAHPRVLEWNTRVLEDLQEAEELEFLREMDSEEAINAYYENNDMV